jgi:broad specificity phosphatase PhoE
MRDLLQGVTDTPLTPAGIAQANALRRRIAPLHIDRVFSSDLPRAVRTACIAMGARNVPFEFRSELRERDWGTFEGKHASEYRAALEASAELLGVESFDALRARVTTFLAEVRARYRGTLLLSSHRSVNRMIALVLMNRPTRDWPNIGQRNACYNEFLIRGDAVTPEAIDCVRHLEAIESAAYPE